MPPRKKQENRGTDDCPRKRRRAQEEGNVVISDRDEDEDFRPTSSSSRGERKREKESRTRTNEMTEEEMLDLAMRLSKQEASSAALRQRQEEEAVRKAIAESLYADSPTHPHSESSLGSGGPTQQCQNSPPEGESSIQPPRCKLSYPNHGVADREGACGGGVHVEVAPSDRRRKGKKEGSPSQSSPLSQASTSVPLPSSQEEGSSQRNLFGDRSAKAIESQDYNNSTKSDSQSQLRIKSPGFPSTTAPQANKPVLCLEKLSQDLLVDCQASGFLLKGHPSLTLPTKSQKSQSYQPKSPTFSNTPVFSKTERGVEPGQSSPSFPKRAMFSNCDSGEEEKEASPTIPKSLVFFKTDRGKAEEQGSPTSPKSTMFSKTERGPEEKETFSGSPVFPRTDQIRDQGPQSCVESVSATGDYEDGDRDDAVKSRDASECLPPCPRTTLSLNKRFVPIRKTAGVSDKVVDQEEREGESSQRTVNRISMPAKLAAEEDLNSEELTLALETQPMQELTSNMALRWSDDDEEENGPEKSAHSPSPVFPQENDLPQPSNQGLSPNTHDHRSPQHKHSPCLVPKKRTHNFEGAACEEGESQSKCIRKKFTLKGMYGAPCPSLLRQAAGRSQDEAKGGSTSSHQPLASSSRLSPPTDGQGYGGVVRYYWGVPFCPLGQNPDAYTQVILSQLEVYEKSLKEAQRGLLRKAGWGEPVLPGPPEKPFSRRGRLERRRAPRLMEEEERGGKRQEELVEVVEDDDEDEGEKRKSPSPVFHADTSQLILLQRRLGLRRKEERLAEKQPPDLLEEREEDEKEEKMDDKEGGEKREEEEVDVRGLQVPETQLSDDSTQDLMVTSPAQPQPESQSLPQIQTFLSSPRPLEQREEGMLVVGEEEGRRSSPVGIPAVGEDVRMEEDIPEPAFPRSPNMDCPMCMRLFPLTEIEMHAAYCDGTTGIMEEEMAEESHSQGDFLLQDISVKARRKRTRRGENIGEEQPSSSGSGKVVQGEKCFLCQQLFPLKYHEKHVEDCIKNKEFSKAAPRDGQLFWSSVCVTIFQSGDFLSALDQTEHIYSGTAEAKPCDTTINNQQSGLIDDLDTAESGGRGDFSAPGFRVSTSPIQSFTPVSEATDCLIDF
ncbi:BRCA1-A complex subunit RAP80 isoform X1 [Oncorhynchus kisutch]|uniref:BRCA1-A complex subunit RAP80 isoform X1 n=2 Tax=Oncorhynchus kisutch TaxID=8019 RepID=UPI0012DE01A1|nr:BRCA1-A complex subunit RAP80 isoform X1 [Oncorhynchus kisutch]XP_031664467.1 BRCA1-A complex subunit RAP80 isoform X1 [Oncorhynchus kisutch]